MTIKQIVSAYKSHQATPCPLTERLVGAGYQQTIGGYIDRAKELSIKINYRSIQNGTHFSYPEKSQFKTQM